MDPDVVSLLGSPRGNLIEGRVVLSRSGRLLWTRPARKFMTAWSEVYSALHAHVPETIIHRGRTVTHCESQPDGIVLHFDEGSSATFDLVVGADGTGSVVRQTVAPDFQPEYLGYIAIRGTIEDAVTPRRLRPTSSMGRPPWLGELLRFSNAPGGLLGSVGKRKGAQLDVVSKRRLSGPAAIHVRCHRRDSPLVASAGITPGRAAQPAPWRNGGSVSEAICRPRWRLAGKFTCSRSTRVFRPGSPATISSWSAMPLMWRFRILAQVPVLRSRTPPRSPKRLALAICKPL